NGGGSMEFILPSGVVLTSFEPTFAPVVGYLEEAGVDDENRYEPREYPADWYKEKLKPEFGAGSPFKAVVTLHGPWDFTLNSVGTLVSDKVDGGRRTSVWQTDVPVRFFNVVAGRWAVRKGEGTAIYYDPRHSYNIEEMGEA